MVPTYTMDLDKYVAAYLDGTAHDEARTLRDALVLEVQRTWALTPPANLDPNATGPLASSVYFRVEPGDMTRYEVVITACHERHDAPWLVCVVGMGSYFFNGVPALLPDRGYIIDKLRLRGTYGPEAVAEFVRCALHTLTTGTALIGNDE